MAYLKPQSPLKNNDDYIYPLTTADQVIMEDGSRLNQLATPKAGFIYPLASDVVPEGFLLCDGAEYLRDEYPELFAVIGTMYGEGDGSTTFNVPNLQNNNMQTYTVVNYIIATGKNTGVSIADIITGIQTLPLSTEYGGTGATNIVDARKNLGVDNYVVDKVIYGKGKNLLKNTAKSQTVNGITFTVNDDGSITVNGTNNTQSKDTDFYIWGSNADNGSYIHMPKGSRISGFTENGGNYLVICREKTRGALLTTYGINSALAESDCYFYGILYRVSAGITLDNVTLYPMLRLASETDDTYEPYYEGLKKLTDRGMELLWENGSPTSSFSAKTISVDLTNWEKIIVFVYDTASDCSLVSEYGKKGHTSRISVARLYNPSGTKYLALTRKFTVSDDGINFTNSVISDGSAAINDNNTMIPVYIYGIKEVS